MGANGKRNQSGRSSTATVLIHPDAAFPEWVKRAEGARISLGRINGGRTVRRLDIDFVQLNFAEKGSVVLRSYGHRNFEPFLKQGIALAITDPHGRLVLNHHTCPRCFNLCGEFARIGGKKQKREEGCVVVWLFECGECRKQWEVPFPALNHNGNGNGHHLYRGVILSFTKEHLELKPPRR